MQLSGVLLPQGLSQGCSPGINQGGGLVSRLVTGEGFPSKLTHVAVGRITSSQAEGLSSLLAVGYRSPSSIPCLVGLSKGQLTTWQLASPRTNIREREGGQPKMEATSFFVI